MTVAEAMRAGDENALATALHDVMEGPAPGSVWGQLYVASEVPGATDVLHRLIHNAMLPANWR